MRQLDLCQSPFLWQRNGGGSSGSKAPFPFLCQSLHVGGGSLGSKASLQNPFLCQSLHVDAGSLGSKDQSKPCFPQCPSGRDSVRDTVKTLSLVQLSNFRCCSVTVT